MKNLNKKIAITTGDVNGIGAEITIKALHRLGLTKENVILISNSDVLDYYNNAVGQECPTYERSNNDNNQNIYPCPTYHKSKSISRLGFLPQQYQIIEIPFDKNNIKPGQITAESGEFSFQCLKKACEMAKNGEIDAIVTAPVSKEALHLAGHKFNGQTEILQHFLAKEGQHAEMLFVAGDFRVLLLTRHVALKDISLNKDELIKKITDLDEFFKAKFGIEMPNFALCALNPHAGENGILGREEIEILQPAVNELRKKEINITNPMPADTLFIEAAKAYLQVNGKWKMENGKLLLQEWNESTDKAVKKIKQDRKIKRSQFKTLLSKIFSIFHFPFSIFHFPHSSLLTTNLYDCYIACYHDQGLIPIKTVASEKTVNMTIGLDVIRTSPCHGTAFDIAGKNLASEDSMIEAILQAIKT